MFDITVSIVFHGEKAYAIPALASLQQMVTTSRATGLRVEVRALLDSPDECTRQIVVSNGSWLDAIEEVHFKDLGLTRNQGVQSASGEYLAFLDGDDLWGDQWLIQAYAAATKDSPSEDAIWHPECLYYFDETDYDRHSVNQIPHPGSKSFLFLHADTRDPEFNRTVLLINNIWSANVFARRALHVRFPYKTANRSRGFGVEDWSWNIETVWAGVPHGVVRDAVHMIRVKSSGSLGRQNIEEGLMVHLPEQVWNSKQITMYPPERI